MPNKPAAGTPLDFADNTLTPRLAAFWACNEGAGTTLHDLTGNGNDITLYKGNDGSLDPAPGWTNGPHGPALSFDGATQWGKAARSASLEPAGALTVGILVTVTAPVNQSVNGGVADLIRKQQSYHGGYDLRWDVGGGRVTGYVSDATAQPLGVTDPTANATYVGTQRLVTMTYEGATGTSCLYVDKTCVATAVNAQLALAHSDALYLMTVGYLTGTSAPANPPPLNLPGVVDMAFVASSALSAGNIGAIVDNPWLFFSKFPANVIPVPTLTATPILVGNVPTILLRGS